MKNMNLIIRLFPVFPSTGEGRCDCFSAIIARETNAIYSDRLENEKMRMFGKIKFRN
jgi:hypothetical protein